MVSYALCLEPPISATSAASRERLKLVAARVTQRTLEHDVAIGYAVLESQRVVDPAELPATLCRIYLGLSRERCVMTQPK